MTFQNHLFVITAGLHSERLATELKDILLTQLSNSDDRQQIANRYGSGKILVHSLKTGDVDAKVNCGFAGEDVYILQQMGSDPWQDLAALCVAAEEAKRSGARNVTGIVPVWKLGRYADDTCVRSGSSDRLTAQMLSGCGLDRLVTLTPTQSMLSPLFPVRVCVPEWASVLDNAVRSYMRRGTSPLLMAYDPQSLPEARRLGQLAAWDVELAWEKKEGWHIGGNYQGRDILIVSSHIRSGMADLSEKLIGTGSGSVAFYAPCIEDPDFRGFCGNRYMPRIITPDEVPDGSVMAEFVHPLPVEWVLAEWIGVDRLDQGAAAFSSGKGF